MANNGNKTKSSEGGPETTAGKAAPTRKEPRSPVDATGKPTPPVSPNRTMTGKPPVAPADDHSNNQGDESTRPVRRPGARPAARPSGTEADKPRPVAQPAGARPAARPSGTEADKPRPVARPAGARPAARPSGAEADKPRPVAQPAGAEAEKPRPVTRPPVAGADRARPAAARPTEAGRPRPAARPAGASGDKPRPTVRSGEGDKPRPAARPTEAPAEGRPTPTAAAAKPAIPKVVELPSVLTVRELAEKLDVSPIDVIKELMANGILANINQQIDYDTAAIVASELEFETVEEKPVVDLREPEGAETTTLWQRICKSERPEDLKPRPPVVTVMGHVDHGKTSLLDAIRHTDVAADEVGGITQHIGAYQVVTHGKKITFLDTPGHEAFTAMRARGAQATDVAILVVAADDGVMPQTKEAIDHARAAQVPIIVALNKMDKIGANPDHVKQQLADLGLHCEEWGGEVICVPLSAKKREGIDDLLENILLVAEVNNLRANPNCPAIGTVIEGQMDKTRGPLATILVQNGTLRVGDAIVVGSIAGRIRNMYNDRGKPVHDASPSTPVSILGLSDVPRAGDILEVVDDHQARAIAAQRTQAAREVVVRRPSRPISLDDVFAQIQAGKVKELNLILKADVQGSIEPIQNSVERLGTEDLKVKFIHVGTGNITESDVALAIASGAIVIGFTVEADAAARRLAEAESVDIRFYNIIYKLIEDVDKALKGMLEPTYADVVMGRAAVRTLFRIPRKGTIAGSYVTDGQIARNATVRVLRAGEKVFEGKVASLRRFTEDVREVSTGFECGVALDGFNDLIEGDILEFYRKERVS